MKNKIQKFIVERLNGKGINVDLQKALEYSSHSFRFFFSGDKGLYVFTLIEDTESAKLEWYEDSHYDESMDEEARNDVRIESPIDKSISEYFKQTFEIGGKQWLLRMS